MPHAHSSATTAPRKRNSTAAGLDGTPGRVIKRRAPTACQGCRARKVRCNVLEHGPPCTNCRLDEIQCSVSVGKRRLRFANLNTDAIIDADKPQGTTAEEILNAVLIRDDSPPSEDNLEERRLNAESISDPTLAYHSRARNSLDTGHKPHLIYQSLDEFCRINALNREEEVAIPFQHMFGDHVESPPRVDALKLPDPTPSPLPPWIKPLSDRIEVDALEYLYKKGALTVPEKPLREELLRCYAEWVHPWTPMLDLPSLIQTVSHEDTASPPLSLLVFQSIMFAGASFADLEILNRAGFETRRDAKQCFFRRTKLLYDFESENDRISLIQALLMMSYWHESPDDQKDIWHWLGIAVSLAHTIGLHRNPASLRMNSKQKSLRKRLWWSILIRDRLVALAMRRSTRIQQKDCNVPMLDLDDFELQLPASDELLIFPPPFQSLQDTGRQRQLATLCIEQVKLCLIVGHVLQTQYFVACIEEGAKEEETNSKTTLVLMPRKDAPPPARADYCDAELNEWITNLPEIISYREEDGSDTQKAEDGIFLHRATLNMLYLTTVNLLHRPQSLSDSQIEHIQKSCSPPATTPSSQLPSTPSRRTLYSLDRTRHAAAVATRTTAKLASMDLLRFLPACGVTVVVHAAIVHLVDVRSPDEKIRNASLAGLGQCMDFLEQLREIYIACDYALYLMYQGMSKANIKVPIPRMPAQSKTSNQCKGRDYSPAYLSQFDSTDDRRRDLAPPSLHSSTGASPSSSSAMQPLQAQPHHPDDASSGLAQFPVSERIGSGDVNTAHFEMGLGNGIANDIDGTGTDLFMTDAQINVIDPAGVVLFDRLAQLQGFGMGEFENGSAAFDNVNDFGLGLDWLTGLGGLG